VKLQTTGAVEKVPVSRLKPWEDPTVVARVRVNIKDLEGTEFETLEARAKALQKLLDLPRRRLADVQRVADTFKVSTVTVYKWLGAFADSGGLTSSLARASRSDKGTTKLLAKHEVLLQHCIDTVWNTQRKRTQKAVITAVENAFKRRRWTVPHPNTIRSRILARTPEDVRRARHGRKAARDQYRPKTGNHRADFPLAEIQIDHVLGDVELVSEHDRQPIGRPWITIAIDVYSRMVVGIYISFDPPNALAVGMCLSSAMLPKESWLELRNVPGEWPVWGRPRLVKADNAREFRGTMIKRAAGEYRIDLKWRPVKRPEFGAHVERLAGTLGQEIQDMPGTTKSNPKKRGEYKSAMHSAYAREEFEERLLDHIVNEYHLRPHKGLQAEVGRKISPLERWKEGIEGRGSTPGTGLPERFKDEQRLMLDWLPYFERTVQDTGVVFEYVRYWEDVLRTWVDAPDPKHAKLKRKFRFSYDPRDMSRVFFFDPETLSYHTIPYRDRSHPPAALWELRRAKKDANVRGKDPANEQRIFASYERRQRKEREVIKKTRSARRAATRREQGFQRAVRSKDPPVKSFIPVGTITPFEED
jgi:putative transposase